MASPDLVFVTEENRHEIDAAARRNAFGEGECPKHDWNTKLVFNTPRTFCDVCGREELNELIRAKAH